jgi:hypothetical protein
MKNLSLRFALVVFALVLVGCVIRNTVDPVELAILLSPLGMVTMLLSVKLHRTAAHVLNMIPTVIWLALPVVYLIEKDVGDLAFMLALVFGPVLLACIVMLWFMAWALRGEEEINEEDFQVRGRLSRLVLPQSSAEARLQVKKSSIPPK